MDYKRLPKKCVKFDKIQILICQILQILKLSNTLTLTEDKNLNEANL